MRVLSIDPGSVTAGFSVLELANKKPLLISSGIMRFDGKKDFLDRIPQIFQLTRELIEQFEPTEFALESLIFVKSPTALIKLAQARGAILAAISQEKGRVFEYAPNMIKSVVTGHGHADKESIQKWIEMQLGVSEFKTHDESDAIAVGLCHLLAKEQVRVKQKKTGKGLAASVSHRIKEI